jgi:hypothetical protein
MSYAPVAEFTDNELDHSKDIPLRPLSTHESVYSTSSEKATSGTRRSSEEEEGEEEELDDGEAAALIGSSSEGRRGGDQEKEGDERVRLAEDDHELESAIVKKVSSITSLQSSPNQN